MRIHDERTGCIRFHLRQHRKSRAGHRHVLAAQADARILRAGEVKPEHLAGVELLVVGAPTHGSMASSAMRAWLKALARGSLRGVKVVAFDTRVAVADVKSRVAAVFVSPFGYAARRIAASLTGYGGMLIILAEGCYIKDAEGPLKDGKLERATAWAQQIVARLKE